MIELIEQEMSTRFFIYISNLIDRYWFPIDRSMLGKWTSNFTLKLQTTKTWNGMHNLNDFKIDFWILNSLTSLVLSNFWECNWHDTIWIYPAMVQMK